MKVFEIFIYPIKSLGGISLELSHATNIGLAHDRRWMLVDDKNKFVSQRSHPLLSQVKTYIRDQMIHCSFKSFSSISIPLELNTEHKRDFPEVQIWDHQVAASAFESEANEWFSELLNFNVRLVFMQNEESRLKRFAPAPSISHVSFADGYPYLITNLSSLQDLNQKADLSLQMQRFRPNIVFNCQHAYEEESLDTFEIGEARFKMIKPCARCVMVNIDPDTGSIDNQALKALNKLRRKKNKVYFGMNAICLKPGIIKKHMEVHI